MAEATVTPDLTEQAGVARRTPERFLAVVDELAVQMDVVVEVHDGFLSGCVSCVGVGGAATAAGARTQREALRRKGPTRGPLGVSRTSLGSVRGQGPGAVWVGRSGSLLSRRAGTPGGRRRER